MAKVLSANRRARPRRPRSSIAYNAERVPMVPVDHIGIAVSSLEAATPLYAAILGLQPSPPETIPAEKVKVTFFGGGSGRVELLEPTDPDSPIARFLDRSGPGLHHLCLRVPDLEAAVQRAIEAGAVLVPPGIRRGADGHGVAFLHPRSTDGVLLELAEGVGLD